VIPVVQAVELGILQRLQEQELQVKEIMVETPITEYVVAVEVNLKLVQLE
jgi:hypothetical protein